MAHLSAIIGIIGNIISILVNTSPIKTFWTVVKKKSTENYKGIPYIITLLTTSLWSFYGILNPNGLLILTVNAAGAFLQFIYVTLFLIYAPKEKKIRTAIMVATIDVIFPGVVVAITLLAIHGNIRLTFVGALCAALTIIMYGAPLSSMRMVIRTKSVEYMPFLLSFTLFLNGGTWLAYAVLVKDLYLGVPNVVGFVLGSAQLILYAIYKNKSVSSKSTETQEGGSTHLVEDGIELNIPYKDDSSKQNEVDSKNIPSLNKGKSLPKPPIPREHSLKKILRTVSLNIHDFHQAGWDNKVGNQDGIAPNDR